MRRPFFLTLLGTYLAVIVVSAAGAGLLLKLVPVIRLSLLAVSVMLGALVALVLAWWLARRVTTPLAQMARDAETITRGQPNITTPRSSIREIYHLTESFMTMAQSLDRNLQTVTAQRNQAQAILESMTEGVIALDAEGRILLINHAAAELFSVDLHQVVGKPLLEAIRQHELTKVWEDVRASRAPVTHDWTLFHPTERLLRAHAVVCEAGRPSELSVVIVIQDLTELRKYERLRKDFVANVSHELKSPLTAIRGLTDTLLEGALEDPANNRRFMSLIAEETLRLNRLIDDLLLLSKIESQPVSLNFQPVNARELLQRVLPTLESEIQKRRLTVQVQVDARWHVQADADRLRQVFMNLLDNAIKYNREGGRIDITAEAHEGMLRIQVTDTGIGIPTEDLPRIFERFYRVDKARSRDLGGTGLGLAIVKHIVESHGGTISATSALNHGSTLTITLPLA